MAAGDTTITMIGNLVDDPELVSHHQVRPLQSFALLQHLAI